MKWLWNKIKTWWKNTWKELKDWKTLILFIIVTIIADNHANKQECPTQISNTRQMLQ